MDDVGNSIYNKNLASDLGGACVGVKYFNLRFLAKAMHCESKAFLACYGDTVHSDTAKSIYDVSS
jgi:hypothetical protein